MYVPTQLYNLFQTCEVNVSIDKNQKSFQNQFSVGFCPPSPLSAWQASTLPLKHILSPSVLLLVYEKGIKEIASGYGIKTEYREHN